MSLSVAMIVVVVSVAARTVAWRDVEGDVRHAIDDMIVAAGEYVASVAELGGRLKGVEVVVAEDGGVEMAVLDACADVGSVRQTYGWSAVGKSESQNRPDAMPS